MDKWTQRQEVMQNGHSMEGSHNNTLALGLYHDNARQEAQLPQRNSASAAHLYLARLAN